MPAPRSTVELIYAPMPKQAQFHRNNKRFRGYFGGMGSGKSFAGCAEVITLSLQYAGNFGLVGRATYPELRDTTWRELLRFPVKVHGKPYEFIHSPLIRSYNKANHEIVLFNGSTIIGRALDDSIDKLGKGLNLGFVYVDELTEIDEATWLSITVGRLRLKLPCNTCGIMPEGDSVKCPKCKKTTIFHTAFGTSNPEGHDWVWKRWISSPNEEHWCIQVNTRDNQYLPKDYVDNLIKQFPEEWVKRYVDGSFDTFEGLVYKDFKDAEPYVVNPFQVPDSWYRFIGLDHGYRNPTAILFGAVDNNGTLWIYDEYYEKGKTVSQIADVIKTKVGEQEIEKYLIDPATRQNKGLNGDKTIFGEFEEEGIFFDCANNQVPAGINRVQQKLMLDAEKQPKIKIFRSCFNLRNELQTYRYADIKPNAVSEEGKEKPVKKDDHLVDALRYMVNYMYDTPKLTKKKREYDYKEMLHNVQQDNNEHWMAS